MLSYWFIIKHHIALRLRFIRQLLVTPSLMVVTTVGALLFASGVMLLSQRSFLGFIWTSGFFSGVQKLQLTGAIALAGIDQLTRPSLVLAVVIAVLVGLNGASLVYQIRQRLFLVAGAGGSVIGVLFSLVGIGCASCGSVILSALFGIGAATVLIGWLPLAGLEFSAVSVALLCLSLYWSAGHLSRSRDCQVK
ncbi:hypothetical protein HY933_04070 [Candidatus Falkowbacteria bacterium]|nr:hypothetical protein [Candidatus Falkowbacteria bacterium]